MRFACIFVPHFAVQAAIRCEPGGKRKWNQPVAILDGPDSLLGVFACNPAAQRGGIEIGRTKVQAEQCPGLVLHKRVVANERAAQSALVDCAQMFSPLVESTEGAVTFDIAGCTRVFGEPQTLARRVRQSAARFGLQTNVAIASNPDAAVVTAKGSDATTIIPPGNEAKQLSPMPIEVLSPTVEQAEILDSWGIRTCGDLAALPRVPLVERLGQAGLSLHTLACGQAQRHLVLVVSPTRFEEQIELEDSLADLESLAFILNRLLNQVSTRLATRGLVTDEIRLCLGLEIHKDRDLREKPNSPSSAVFERRPKFPVPITDTKHLLKLLQLDLAQHGPGAPVKTVAIEAMPAKPRCTQAGLFVPRAPGPEKLELTLARLRSVVGDIDERGRSRVGAAQLCDSHKTDDFEVVPFTSHSGDLNKSSLSKKADIAFSVFRPPLSANVRHKESKPIHISFSGLSGPITSAAGPWFASGLSWNEAEKWNREQWDIAIRFEQGLGLYRIFREKQSWFVEGFYD
jgi:protein ImuB